MGPQSIGIKKRQRLLALLFNDVNQLVMGDPVQPGRKTAAGIERLDISKSLSEYFIFRARGMLGKNQK